MAHPRIPFPPTSSSLSLSLESACISSCFPPQPKTCPGHYGALACEKERERERELVSSFVPVPRPGMVTSSLSGSSGDGERLGGDRGKVLSSRTLGRRDRGSGDGDLPARGGNRKPGTSAMFDGKLLLHLPPCAQNLLYSGIIWRGCSGSGPRSRGGGCCTGRGLCREDTLHLSWPGGRLSKRGLLGT